MRFSAEDYPTARLLALADGRPAPRRHRSGRSSGKAPQPNSVAAVREVYAAYRLRFSDRLASAGG